MTSPQIEWDFYISPDIAIDTAGVIAAADLDDVYSFHNNADRALMSFTGWGYPPVEFVTQRGPYQHGVTLLDYRLHPRVVQYTYRQTGGCRDTYWDNRSGLLNALRINRGATGCTERGRLRKIISDGTVRDLYVVVEKGPVFNGRGSDWDEWSINETIRFIAHDPVVFNPAQQTGTWTLTESSELVFPITFPIFFGTSIINNTLNVTYAGTWLTYPIITIVGPLNGARIRNNSTDEVIELGYDIPAGQILTINLNYGVKTVVDQAGTSYIGIISADSDLATFHIAPDPEVAGGINELVAEGSNADANTAVVITWFDKYIGI